MKLFKIAGKFLDQPILVAKFEQKVPYILTGGGIIYTGYKVKQTKDKKKSNILLKTGITMIFTVLTALLAPKIVNTIFKSPKQTLKKIKKNNTEIIDKFLKENNINETEKKILNKAKENFLDFKEIKQIYKLSDKNTPFLNKLIPEPENISSKEIFSEIGRLSLLGIIPVIGGIGGGVAGDMVTTPKWKEKIPNKIKEGTYQYFANIFLCNIGAGAALAIMEKFGIKGRAPRALGMIAGIVTTGILGGSAIANTLGNKVINPIFGEKKEQGIYSERKPEALDICLHTDDIATVAIMSGLKWIEPALPIMYAISGYRAGIGYRNANTKSKIYYN